jgi:hypothetical protein
VVVIQSKINRSLATNALIALVPDVLIAWAATSITDNGVVGFFGVLIGLQCLYLLLWLKVFVWGWLLFWISGRRKMSAHMETFLVQNRFPRPPKFVAGIADYLSRVANDKKEVGPVRVAAAIEVGTLNGVKLAGKYSMGFQLQLAFEDALERYAKRFPSAPESDEEDDYR